MKIFHQRVEVERFPNWFWKLQNLWLVKLTGINLDTRMDRGRLNLDAKPVYTPFAAVTRSAGQFILDVYLWRDYCWTLMLMRVPPYIVVSGGKIEEYEELPDAD